LLRPYIRIDAGLQPTAVGGAVVDAQARVIGVATSRYARFGAVALPAAMVTGVADTLLEKGHIPRGYLGVGLQPVRLPESLRESLQRAERTAVIVIETEPEGPAHKAGVMIGDILVSLGDKPVAHLGDVQEQLAGDTIGKPLAATILRGGTVKQLTLVVGERVGREK
jgi:S1-C subfamily serine protease